MTAPTTPRTRVRAGRRAVHGKGPREDGCTCGELPASHLPGCPVVPLMTPAGRKLLGKTLGLRILPEEVEAIEQQAAAAERQRLALELESALDALGGMWSWNDAYLDDPQNAHLWAVIAGRILRELVGRPARQP